MSKPVRKFTVGIKTSLNLAPPAVIRYDLEKLREGKHRCIEVIRGYDRQIVAQRKEQKELEALVENPGIYNAEACAKAAARCNDHIKTFEASIKKEQLKIEHYDRMIKELEKRLCLSEMI
jgi:hypothetical protein